MWEQLTQQIAKESGKTFGSKAQLVQLAEFQRRYEECARIENLCTPQAAKSAYIEHMDELQAAIKRGDLEKTEAFSREDFEREFELKGQAAKDARAVIAKEARPIVEDISERFAEVAEQFAAAQAKAEADAYAKFGVQFPGPSSLIATLRKAADFARARVPRTEYANSSPRTMLPYCDF